jgi:hypothetical protein
LTWPIRCPGCNKAYTFVEERTAGQPVNLRKQQKHPPLLWLGGISTLTGLSILPFAIYASSTGERVTLPSRHAQSSHTAEQLLWMAIIPIVIGLVLLTIHFFTMDRYK